MSHILHGRSAESRGHLLLLLLVLTRDIVVHANLAKATVHIDLPSVLGLLNLHLALEVLAELHHVLLLGHNLVLPGTASRCWFVILHHVYTHKVLPSSSSCRGFTDRLRSLLDFDILLNFFKGSFGEGHCFFLFGGIKLLWDFRG